MTHSPIRVRRAVLAAALLAAWLPAGCGKEQKAKAGPMMGPVAVTVGKAERRDVPTTLRVVGSVEASHTVSVRARVSGELTRVSFAEGQDVREGDPLFQIDPLPYRVALRQAEANLARDAAKSLAADAEARRYADLVAKDYVTRQQADDVDAAAASARATLRADSALVEQARLNLGYSDIRAPISGRTGNLMVHEGNLVGANDSRTLVVINRVAPAIVSFSVPERRLAEVRGSMGTERPRVEARLPADSTRVFEGELAFIDNAVDEATGTVLLKAAFPNEDRTLWPGQFVNVSLCLDVREGAVVVPSPAVQTGQQGDFVFVVQADGTVQMRPVRAGIEVDGRTLVESGVEEGETVVTDGQLRLVPGAKISVKPPAGSAPAAGAGSAQPVPAQTGTGAAGGR